ncbi:MAG: hypothetical protein FJ117_06590 [Deltaproteobacteria bacterium]|nr:hypothetical protein [Deltaproteobacteria bacterium]
MRRGKGSAQLIPEKGHVLPGQLVIGSDSHTTTNGALNALATAVGSTDLALAIHYGLLWFMVPPSMKIEIPFQPLPELMKKIVQAGGIIPFLESREWKAAIQQS